MCFIQFFGVPSRIKPKLPAVMILLLLFSHSVMFDFFATPWTAAHQAPPLSMRFSRQEHCNGLPFPSPGNLPNPGIEPKSPALAGGLFATVPTRRPSDDLLDIKLYIQQFSVLLPFSSSPSRVSWDHFPNKLLMLKLWVQSLFLGEHGWIPTSSHPDDLDAGNTS